MILHPERDGSGKLKFYTNIVIGQYFTFDSANPNKICLCTPQMSSKQKGHKHDLSDSTKAVVGQILASHRRIDGDMKSSLWEHRNLVYEEHFLKQIIKYQQLLLQFRSKVSEAVYDLSE